MKLRLKKALCLFFSICLLSLVFSSCSDEENTIEDDGTWILLFNDCKIDEDTFRHYYLGTKALTDYYNNDYWETGDQELLKKNTVNVILDYYITDFIAERYGVSLTDSEKAEVVAAEETTIQSEYGGRDSYNAALEQVALTYDVRIKSLELAALKEKVMDYFFSAGAQFEITDENLEENIRKYYIEFDHYLIPYDTDGTTKNKEIALEIEAKLAEGATFEQIDEDYFDYSAEYSEYFVTKLSLFRPQPEFYQALDEMKPGEYSKMIETPLGYSFLFLKETDPASASKQKEEIISELQEAIYIEKSLEELKNITIRYSSAYNGINIHSYDDTIMQKDYFS